MLSNVGGYLSGLSLFRLERRFPAYSSGKNLPMERQLESNTCVLVNYAVAGELVDLASQVWNESFFFNCLASGERCKGRSKQGVWKLGRIQGELHLYGYHYPRFWLRLVVTRSIKFCKHVVAANATALSGHLLPRLQYMQSWWNVVNWTFVNEK